VSKHVEKGGILATDLELVVDRQVLAGTAFSHDVLQRCCARGVRDVVVQREGEGEVRLSIGFDVDVFRTPPPTG
jgi:hypothetical protein